MNDMHIPSVDLLPLVTKPLPLHHLALYISFPIFALKQIISVIQLSTAVKRILALDEADRAKRAE